MNTFVINVMVAFCITNITMSTGLIAAEEDRVDFAAQFSAASKIDKFDLESYDPDSAIKIYEEIARSDQAELGLRLNSLKRLIELHNSARKGPSDPGRILEYSDKIISLIGGRYGEVEHFAHRMIRLYRGRESKDNGRRRYLSLILMPLCDLFDVEFVMSNSYDITTDNQQQETNRSKVVIDRMKTVSSYMSLILQGSAAADNAQRNDHERQVALIMTDVLIRHYGVSKEELISFQSDVDESKKNQTIISRFDEFTKRLSEKMNSQAKPQGVGTQTAAPAQPGQKGLNEKQDTLHQQLGFDLSVVKSAFTNPKCGVFLEKSEEFYNIYKGKGIDGLDSAKKKTLIEEVLMMKAELLAVVELKKLNDFQVDFVKQQIGKCEELIWGSENIKEYKALWVSLLEFDIMKKQREFNSKDFSQRADGLRKVLATHGESWDSGPCRQYYLAMIGFLKHVEEEQTKE